MLLLAISGIALAISLCIAIGEAWFERDWPRHSFKYVVIFAITTFGFLCVISS
jgi:hypothetical protein